LIKKAGWGVNEWLTVISLIRREEAAIEYYWGSGVDNFLILLIASGNHITTMVVCKVVGEHLLDFRENLRIIIHTRPQE
jgi:hypothetical protein